MCFLLLCFSYNLDVFFFSFLSSIKILLLRHIPTTFPCFFFVTNNLSFNMIIPSPFPSPFSQGLFFQSPCFLLFLVLLRSFSSFLILLHILDLLTFRFLSTLLPPFTSIPSLLSKHRSGHPSLRPLVISVARGGDLRLVTLAGPSRSSLHNETHDRTSSPLSVLGTWIISLFVSFFSSSLSTIHLSA